MSCSWNGMGWNESLERSARRSPCCPPPPSPALHCTAATWCSQRVVVCPKACAAIAMCKEKSHARKVAGLTRIARVRSLPLLRPPAPLVQMRSVYGKLVYIIQDSVNPAISELMGFHLYR